MQADVYTRMAALEETHWWFVARRRILCEALDRLNLPPGARILEAGCGTGGNLAMLARYGRVSAFEPDLSARTCAAAKGDFDVREGHLPDNVPFELNSFDLVVALDVIEHLDHDQSCLDSLGKYLKPGGFGLFTVPAFAFLWSRHDESHHHKRRYSKPEINRLVTAAGLKPVILTYFNTLLFPLIAGIRIVKNKLGMAGSVDDTLPSPFINRLLTALFSSERHFLGRVALPVGVSLLMVARK